LGADRHWRWRAWGWDREHACSEKNRRLTNGAADGFIAVDMFLRRIRPSGRGARQTYWALVESYRTPAGSRQRVVAYLGKLTGRQSSGWEQLSDRLGGKLPAAPGLFEAGLPAPQTASIDLKSLTVRRARDFGDVYLGLALWRLLGLEDFLSGLMPTGREDVPWEKVARILCLARFCHPCSELYIQRQWYGQTALDDLLSVPVEKVHTDRLYAGLDQLLPHKKALEGHLRQRLGELFKLEYDLLLYDLTSTYFEGQAKGNPMAKRGYSRDSRPDCLQVVIALIVTREGYPLGYEVFDGNTADVTTVQQIIGKVEEQHGKAQRIWVMDRGNTSEANLAFIRERNGHYIVGTPKAQMGRFAGEITEAGWREVREGIEVKLARNPAAGSSDRYLLCRSRERAAKERSMAKRFEERMEAGLGKLAQAAAKGRLRDAAVAHQRLGRLLEKHWRAAGLFDVTIDQQADGRLQVRWSKRADREAWIEQSSGCYVLRTNLENPDPVELWKSYIQLTDAEWAFRITKDELEIRPIWHHSAARVQAHILVCFLAYTLWKTLGGWMKLAGLGDAPRAVVDELHTIRSVDVELQTMEDGLPGPPLTVRCVTRPDDHQAVLLERLGLELPNQIKRFQMPLESTLAIEVPPAIAPM